MQAKSGGVYHKVTCQDFAGYIMPEDEIGQLIVTPVSTTATADFAAVMAMGYEFYYDIDRNFAETCLEAAKKAWSFLENNPNLIFSNRRIYTQVIMVTHLTMMSVIGRQRKCIVQQVKKNIFRC